MSVEEAVLEKLRELSPERQQKVLEYVESLVEPTTAESTRREPLRSIKGICAGQGTVTEEEIAEARREMWGHFPRDIDP